MLVSKPSEAMIAPPGTPGAATMVMPSIATNPIMVTVSKGDALNYHKRYGACHYLESRARSCGMVAQRGMTNPAVSRLTPMRTVRASRIVAADD